MVELLLKLPFLHSFEHINNGQQKMFLKARLMEGARPCACMGMCKKDLDLRIKRPCSVAKNCFEFYEM